MINKPKIIYFLVAIVASLLLINVVLSFTKPKQNYIATEQLPVAEIESNFLNILNEFALEENWLVKQKLKKEKYDSINTKYMIRIPIGTTIPEIIKDINAAFQKSPVVLTSEEKKVYGSTILTIKSGGFTKLISEFIYDSGIERKFEEIGFLITEFENADEIQRKLLFDLAIPVGVILPLEEESKLLAEEIRSRKLNYFIQLKENSDYSEFELDEDSGLDQLSKNVTNIISSFNSPEIFFINELESGFNASTTNFITDQFKKRGRRLLTSNNYIYLKGEDVDDLNSLVKFHLNKLASSEAKIFRIRIEDWFEIQGLIKAFMKKGNKIDKPENLL